METKNLVRIRPYNKQRGHVVKTYSCGDVKFVGEHGWYRVTEALAEELSTVRQVHGDLDSPLAFDVCTEAEAQEIDERESDARTVRKTAEKSIVITDVRKKDSVETSAKSEAHATKDAGEGDKQDKPQRRGG